MVQIWPLLINADSQRIASEYYCDVSGRDCIIVDDMIDTGGTLSKAAEALKIQGARRVFAYNPSSFSGNAVANFKTQ